IDLMANMPPMIDFKAFNDNIARISAARAALEAQDTAALRLWRQWDGESFEIGGPAAASLAAPRGDSLVGHSAIGPDAGDFAMAGLNGFRDGALDWTAGTLSSFASAGADFELGFQFDMARMVGLNPPPGSPSLVGRLVSDVQGAMSAYQAGRDFFGS